MPEEIVQPESAAPPPNTGGFIQSVCEFLAPPRTRILVVVICVLLGLLLGGVYYAFNGFQKRLTTESLPPGPTVQRVIDSGKLVIGADATFPPMEFMDASGKLVGYDVDLGTRIAEELGVEAEFVNISWDNIFDVLLQGEVDVVISSVTITEERELTYDFSDSYINAGQVIITRTEDASIQTTADLAGKKIAVQEGTTNEEQALLYTSEDLVLTYADFIDATEALLSGEADAIFSDLTGAKGIIDANAGLKIASDPFTSDFYGVTFRKDEEDLVAEVNQILTALRQEGFMVFLKQKWLE